MKHIKRFLKHIARKLLADELQRLHERAEVAEEKSFLITDKFTSVDFHPGDEEYRCPTYSCALHFSQWQLDLMIDCDPDYELPMFVDTLLNDLQNKLDRLIHDRRQERLAASVRSNDS